MKLDQIIYVVAAVLMACSGAAIQAQAPDRCSVYNAAIAPDKSAPAVVPESYLIDVNAAMPCLIAAIERLGSQITSVTMDADTKNKLLSASAALRSVMTRLDALDKQSGNSDGLNRFITLFRDKSSLATISALTFGARNDDKDLRLNSVLLLGNVIDNRSVCVPLTHLNDPDFMKATEAVKARANLLGVVSVVAPWAYRENFNSIQKTHDSIENQISRNDPGLKTTVSILDNIQQRLAAQKPNSNKDYALSTLVEGGAKECRLYVDAYTPKLTTPGNVDYSQAGGVPH
jgi:hypothetical protein